ncbi:MULTISPECIES: hypothetical protein [unclassified Methylobacterium]|uniref:hypothetical protein n=1 Tax=unclassified Methylobacterium TaxID=2615210 RepID=UPI00068A535C|nr:MULTISPECIES: hypothetical protein [unclassified Methylobacterium]SFU51797.1 hypothetical protein SAMN02799643_01041 [Methylobacterium sp. UNCCL125]
MCERRNIASDAFDGAVAWAGLPAHVQARIGAAAVELGVAMALSEHARMPACRAGDEAVERAGELLREAVVGYDGVPEGSWWEGTADAGTFRIPSVVGMVCHACGCSHLDPCPDGCGWASDNLCTACAPGAGVEAAAPLPAGSVVVDGVTRHEPELSETEARAIVRGACRAVSTSELARPVEPVGSHLRELARAIDGMGGEDGDGR